MTDKRLITIMGFFTLLLIVAYSFADNYVRHYHINPPMPLTPERAEFRLPTSTNSSGALWVPSIIIDRDSGCSSSSYGGAVTGVVTINYN